MKLFRRSLFPLALAFIAVTACEAIDPNGESELDKTALFDQKPVRTEGWEAKGQSEARFDGLNLSTMPDSKSDGFAQQEITLNSSSLTKKLPALASLETGTLRVQFSFPRIAADGVRLEMSFATGMGLPAELRITQAGLTAKCGSLSVDDGVPTASAAKVFEAQKDYEVRIVRSESLINIVLNKEVLIKDLACTALQNSNEEARAAGWARFVLFAQLPAEPLTWTATQMLQHENQVLLKRVTVYKDALLENKKK